MEYRGRAGMTRAQVERGKMGGASGRFGSRLLAALIFAVLAGPVRVPPSLAQGETAREVVDFDNPYGQGAIVIKTSERRLYYTISNKQAVRYPIAVGSPENQWYGTSYVSSMREDPSWRPTASMRRKNPRLPTYVAPGPENPLGVRAIYLAWTAYRIHGTNAPGSIGQAVSSGCFRMQNEHVIELYERVHIGAPVYVEH